MECLMRFVAGKPPSCHGEGGLQCRCPASFPGTVLPGASTAVGAVGTEIPTPGAWRVRRSVDGPCVGRFPRLKIYRRVSSQPGSTGARRDSDMEFSCDCA